MTDMTPRSFVLIAVCAAVFVWVTSAELPSVVASHFGASGLADGFMPKQAYIYLMLALLVALPSLLVALTWWAVGSSRARINVPNKDYWLAPERRASTVAYLRTGLVRFAIVMMVFLCYAHWLVVRANGRQPPQLDNAWFIGGLVVFVLAVLVWLGSFYRHFRRTDASP